MVKDDRLDVSVRHERPRRRFVQVAGLALGIVAFGATGMTGTLAQEDDAVSVIGGSSVAGDDFINSILAEVFAEVFGGSADDEADVSGGGDINVGGNVGGSVTMGGSSGGGISVGGSGGSSGGITVGGGSDSDG